MNPKQRLIEAISSEMESLLSGATHPALLKYLKTLTNHLSFAVILHWIPEQEADLFWVLLNDKTVGAVELPRTSTAGSARPTMRLIPLREYRKIKANIAADRKLQAALQLYAEQRS